MAICVLILVDQACEILLDAADARSAPPVFASGPSPVAGGPATAASGGDCEGDPETVAIRRLCETLIDAEDGRFDDALGALALIAAERPGDTAPSLQAGAVCNLVGQAEEGIRWLARGRPQPPPQGLRRLPGRRRVGCARRSAGRRRGIRGPGDLRGLLLEILNMTPWARVFDGDMSVYKKLLISIPLKGVAIKRKYMKLLKRAGVHHKDDRDLDSTVYML